MCAKRKRGVCDIVQVFASVPELTGMEMRLHAGVWEGRYYISGERHPWKRDKLKVKIWNGSIWLHEQGGRSMSLATWLVNYGGCADYREAYRVIEGNDCVKAGFAQAYTSGAVATVREAYVPADEYAPYRDFPLWGCPLFRWMSGIFGRERVEAAWRLYGATTDERGLAVWWYIDADGRVCHDKRMRYREDGHRDKSFGGTRKYRVGDGFTARTMFGAHIVAASGVCGSEKSAETPVEAILSPSDGLLGIGWRKSMPNIENALKTQKINIVESEKTALLATLAFGGVWIATGGKGNLRDTDADMMLWPDMDAASEWSCRGDVCEWWQDAEQSGVNVGEHWDLGDLIVILTQKSLTLRKYQQNISENGD